MRKPKLDRTDLKILQKLQEDGRITNVELAKHAGISAPPCLRRVRSLEKADVIQSYHADINPMSLGYGITVFAQIKLASQNDAQVKEFQDLLETWPMVRECHLLAGEVDFLLKIVAKDWESYQNFLTHKLSALEEVVSVKTATLVRTSKKQPGVPIDF